MRAVGIKLPGSTGLGMRQLAKTGHGDGKKGTNDLCIFNLETVTNGREETTSHGLSCSFADRPSNKTIPQPWLLDHARPSACATPRTNISEAIIQVGIMHTSISFRSTVHCNKAEMPSTLDIQISHVVDCRTCLASLLKYLTLWLVSQHAGLDPPWYESPMLECMAL